MKSIYKKSKAIVFLRLFVILSLLSVSLYAQQKTSIVTGKVTTEENEPVIGGTVTLKNTKTELSQTTITDINGVYTFSKIAAGGPYSITVSYLGYTTQTLAGYTLKSDATFTLIVKLKQASIKIDELVVVGYGTILKSDLTGSVSKVKLENAAQQTSSSFEQLLQGKAAGVSITQTSGDPGSGIMFNIRGGNSLNGNQPLIVIDGYPVESDNATVSSKSGAEYWTTEQKPGNALANLNPNDIESIEILKDASSTAIFGSRGANGVVMITTKRGQEGKDKITFNFRSDISSIPKNIQMLHTPDFIKYANEASLNSAVVPAFDSTAISRAKDNVWQDLVYQTSYSKDYQISATGGDSKLRYALIGNYTTIDGIVKHSNYTKQGFTLNLDREFSKKIKIGLSSKVNASNNQAGYQSTNHAFIGGSVVGGALRWAPTSTLLDEDGELIISSSNQSNPLITLEKSKNLTKNLSILANFYAEYQISKALKFRATGGFNINDNNYFSYWSRGTQIGDSNNGQAYQATNNNVNYLTEFTLNYNKTIAKVHRISAVGGYTNQNWRSNANGIVVRGFPNDNLSYNALQYGSNILTPTTSYREWALVSFLGRVNYTYDNRYLLTVTGRRDGSSRLSKENRWDFFPSVALGWNIHNEKFFKGNDILSLAKLKASYGVSGNQNISIGATQALFGISRSANTFNNVLTGVALTSFDNPNLKWERTKQLNLGLELGFAKNKYNLNVDYYKKVTSDLLINLALPADNGFNTYSTNLGEIQNSGLEFEVEAKWINKTFKWSSSANISFNNNNVNNVGPNAMILGGNLIPTGLDQIGSVAMPGYAVGSFYGYKIAGIYQNAAEVAAGPIDPVNPKPGDFKYVDLNGDGKIGPEDRSIIGNPNAKYIFGFTNNFSYKKFDLSIFFMGKMDYSVLNLNRFYSDGLVYSASGNIRQEAFDGRWTGEGTSNYYPRAKRTGSLFDKRVSDFLVEDGSFVRLKNVNLSYNFQIKQLKFLTNLKVFTNVTNLLTFTKYKGYDPEVSGLGLNALNQNIDQGTIPQYRTFSFGINAGF